MGWYRDEYLKSEDWKNLRAAVLHHRGYQCEVCCSVDKLDVHHRRYRKIWNVLPKDLKVLCRDCHTQEHRFLDFGKRMKIRRLQVIPESKRHLAVAGMLKWNIKRLKSKKAMLDSLAGTDALSLL